MKKFPALLVLLLASGAYAQQNSQMGVLWTHSSGKEIAASPLVSDVNGDWKPEIIFATLTGAFHFLTPAGSEIYSFETNDSVSSDVLPADVNGDGLTELVYGSADGVLRARDPSGRLLWGFQTGGKITATPIYVKQTSEILFGSHDGTLYAVDMRGALSWSRKGAGAIRYAASAADTDRNGKPGIVYGSDDNSIYYVNRFSGRVYAYAADSDIAAAPAAKDIDMDGRAEIIAATRDGKIHALNIPVNGSSPKVIFRWQFNASGSIESSLGAADLDGDKKSEIFFGASGAGLFPSGYLYILNATGKVVRAYTTTGTALSAPVAGDYDGDKKTEIVFATDKGFVYLLNSSGDAKWTTSTKEAVKHPPYAYDFNRDAGSEIILAAGNTLYLIGSLADNDSDGARDYEEYIQGTDRNKYDTDGDGLADGVDSEPLSKKAIGATTSTTLPAPKNPSREAVNETPPEEYAQETPPAASEPAGEEDAPAPQDKTDYAPVLLCICALGVLMYAARHVRTGKGRDIRTPGNSTTR